MELDKILSICQRDIDGQEKNIHEEKKLEHQNMMTENEIKQIYPNSDHY